MKTSHPAPETPQPLLHWFKNYVHVCDGSRWLGRFNGQYQVWRVEGQAGTGKAEHYQPVSYLLTREDVEPGCSAWLTIPYQKMQELVQKNLFINIGQYTKEQWLQMSRG